MKIPQTIFKYFTTADYNLTALKNGQIYFGAPINFNDPYECNYGINFYLDESKLNEFIERIPKGAAFSEALYQELNHPKEEIIGFMEEEGKTIFAELQQKMQVKRGIACFSEINNSILMWAHYANSYKGFCLEFDTTLMPFSSIIKVDYAEKFPSVDILRMLDVLNPQYGKEETEKAWKTKSLDWDYEKEWRILHNKAGTLYGYEQEALKAIYFGPKMDSSMRQILCLIIQGQNKDVKFYQGEISKTEYKVEFKEFHYTPHIVAKEKGLI